MRGLATGFVLVGWVFGVPAAFAGTRVEPVHPERERMSASSRRQALVDDLDALLVGPATPTSIATAPRAVDTGLCQRDVIALQYRHGNESNRKDPFKPIGIVNVIQEYHRIGYSDEWSQRETQKACRSLDGDKDYWAFSVNESTAHFGLGALKEVAAAVHANQGVTLDCKALQNAAIEARCASEFLAVADHPSAVNDCSRISARSRPRML